ncbi:extracellular solute-binding protein [Veronia pacifica]|nr:extracellular solute-binding protein [Veronia pacifica]
MTIRVFTLLALLFAFPLFADSLVVASRGGVYNDTLKKTIITPFYTETDIYISLRSHNDRLLSERELTIDHDWDVIEMPETLAITACEGGVIRILEVSNVLKPIGDFSAEQDFAPRTIRKCSVAHQYVTTLIAFDEQAFGDRPPKRIDDFFNVTDFPGKRGLEKKPDTLLEWALLAQGVPTQQVYPLLSTERGIDLALKKLDDIYQHIVWWQDAREARELLLSGEVTMSSGYDSELAPLVKHLPFSTINDGKLRVPFVWAISSQSVRIQNAKKFITYATLPIPMSKLAKSRFAHPTRYTAIKTENKNNRQFRTSTEGTRILIQDSDWFVATKSIRQEKFKKWLKEKLLTFNDGG